MSYEEEDFKALFRRQFKGKASAPISWVLCAENLKMAANYLRQSAWPALRKNDDREAWLYFNKIGPAYMLLMAFAVENMLKAMIVKKDPAVVKAEKLANRFTRGHDLYRLWEMAGICPGYNRACKPTLERLTIFATSFGRYPVTKTAEQMGEGLRAHCGVGTFARVDSLWKILDSELKRVCPEISCDV